MPIWLPPIVPYSDFNGDWVAFLEEIYSQFRQDFLDDFNRRSLTFDGGTLRVRRHPLVRGKEASFWHLISTGDIEEDRIPDFDRCERIKWARAIIDNHDDPAIKKFKSERSSNINICLWLESENYMVVLGQRNGYTILLTAYVVTAHRAKALQKDYEAYLKKRG